MYGIIEMVGSAMNSATGVSLRAMPIALAPMCQLKFNVGPLGAGAGVRRQQIRRVGLGWSAFKLLGDGDGADTVLVPLKYGSPRELVGIDRGKTIDEVLSGAGAAGSVTFERSIELGLAPMLDLMPPHTIVGDSESIAGLLRQTTSLSEQRLPVELSRTTTYRISELDVIPAAGLGAFEDRILNVLTQSADRPGGHVRSAKIRILERRLAIRVHNGNRYTASAVLADLKPFPAGANGEPDPRKEQLRHSGNIELIDVPIHASCALVFQLEYHIVEEVQRAATSVQQPPAGPNQSMIDRVVVLRWGPVLPLEHGATDGAEVKVEVEMRGGPSITPHGELVCTSLGKDIAFGQLTPLPVRLQFRVAATGGRKAFDTIRGWTARARSLRLGNLPELDLKLTQHRTGGVDETLLSHTLHTTARLESEARLNPPTTETLPTGELSERITPPADIPIEASNDIAGLQHTPGSIKALLHGANFPSLFDPDLVEWPPGMSSADAARCGRGPGLLPRAEREDKCQGNLATLQFMAYHHADRNPSALGIQPVSP